VFDDFDDFDVDGLRRGPSGTAEYFDAVAASFAACLYFHTARAITPRSATPPTPEIAAIAPILNTGSLLLLVSPNPVLLLLLELPPPPPVVPVPVGDEILTVPPIVPVPPPVDPPIPESEMLPMVPVPVAVLVVFAFPPVVVEEEFVVELPEAVTLLELLEETPVERVEVLLLPPVEVVDEDDSLLVAESDETPVEERLEEEDETVLELLAVDEGDTEDEVDELLELLLPVELEVDCEEDCDDCPPIST
jgi:hypothetical protein